MAFPSARIITMVQNTVCSRPGSIGCNLSKDLASRAVPIRNYLAILTQLGARTALHIALPPRPAGGPTSSIATTPMTASPCQPTKNRWGMPSTCATTLPHTGATKTPSAGIVPAGYRPVTIAGIPCNSKPATANRNGPILRQQPSNS